MWLTPNTRKIESESLQTQLKATTNRKTVRPTGMTILLRIFRRKLNKYQQRRLQLRQRQTTHSPSRRPRLRQTNHSPSRRLRLRQTSHSPSRRLRLRQTSHVLSRRLGNCESSGVCCIHQVTQVLQSLVSTNFKGFSTNWCTRVQLQWCHWRSTQQHQLQYNHQ